MNLVMSESCPQWDANLYQAAHAFVWQKAADLLDLLAPKSGEHILDLGCGTGQLTADIARRGASVIGLDRSSEMIQQAGKNYPAIHFEIGDATTFTLDACVDAVFSNATLHWVKPPEAAVKQIWTALKPGGRFIAEFGGRGNVEQVCKALRVALGDVAEIEFDSINPWYFPSIAEYAGMLERQGFDVTFAQLFPRPTRLEGGEQGMRNWIKMFGAPLLNHVASSHYDAVLTAAENHAHPTLFEKGQWTADYVRLRIVANRPISS